MNSARKLCSSNLLGHTAVKYGISQFRKEIRIQSKFYHSENLRGMKLVPIERLKTWRSHFPHIIDDLKSTIPEGEKMAMAAKWVDDVVDYNTPHGKGIRAIQVILADQYLSNDTSPENILSINQLAWMMELVQASACVVDDILDESETRRDRLCWHKVNNRGMEGFNDGWFLNCAVYELLRKYFGHTDYYSDLFELFLHTTQAGTYGECRDVRNALGKNYDLYNLEFYKDMMEFKNGFYTFYLPIVTTMKKNGIRDKATHMEVERLALDIGYLFAMQDDYLDCFVDPMLTGKIGTDIEDGKCTWLIVNAFEKSSEQQRQLLLENYGSKDPLKVKRIKELYQEIGVPQHYKNTETELTKKLQSQTGHLSVTKLRPFFNDLIGSLLGRVR